MGCQLADHHVEDFSLKVKSSCGETKTFSLIEEASLLKGLDKDAKISHYDMSKLEVEYDYDTENEQIQHSKGMLTTDLCDAIEWFIMDDPLNIVQNLNNY